MADANPPSPPTPLPEGDGRTGEPSPLAPLPEGEGWRVHEHLARDGYRWKYRQYTPTGEARGIVIFIHGIQSHAGWYEFSCSKLAAAGYHIFFLDRRGSGMNEQDRGDAPGFRRLLDDIGEFVTTLPRTGERGSLPLFLAGISWGGKLAVAMERRHPGLMNGLILMCPGFFARVRPTLWQRIRILCSRLFRPRTKFPIPLNDPELFTATPRWQQFLRDDPLRLHHATARLLIESVRLDGYLRFTPKYVHVPVLVMLAAEDRIIRYEPTRDFVNKFATPDKTIIEYAGAHHTLEFEPEPERFVRDLQRWLDAHST
ncbi:MAG: alpha/beta fold hydrolase [Planctomycetes bacterium]|nr:alpha/beta fold hydrolase [Planctomycetota bacterium]